MHELSLASGILQMVEDAARRDSFARVRRLDLEVGPFSGVEVAALRFALEAIAGGTLLEGAEVVIDQPAAQARCDPCGRDVQVRDRLEVCPACGGYPLRIPGGNSLKLTDLVVLD